MAADNANELHLPHGSIWPFILAIAITLLGVGILFGGVMLGVGVLALVIALVGWVREDTTWWRNKIGTGEGPGRLGTILFMSSEIFLFGGLFATYFSFRASAAEWPDQHVHLPLLTTGIFSVILISSSFTLHRAEKYLQAGNKKGFHAWWLTSIILGLIFLGGQVNEYITLISEGVTLSSGHFASSFYMITGTHGLHVFGGLVFLIIVYIRSMKGQFTEKRHLAPKAASMYWHFVDAIWIVVFSVLYLIQ